MNREICLCVGLFNEKMGRADKAACATVAKDLATKLKAVGVPRVYLEGKIRYHGRMKVFVDTLREHGIAC
jgi:ribosomal protein L18